MKRMAKRWSGPAEQGGCRRCIFMYAPYPRSVTPSLSLHDVHVIVMARAISHVYFISVCDICTVGTGLLCEMRRHLLLIPVMMLWASLFPLAEAGIRLESVKLKIGIG